MLACQITCVCVNCECMRRDETNSAWSIIAYRIEFSIIFFLSVLGIEVPIRAWFFFFGGSLTQLTQKKIGSPSNWLHHVGVDYVNEERVFCVAVRVR